ncbi:unnamed protein product [Schistocephalus solidus]|uniref:Secreted protein n=1 Tax=Schistocephalus solidus TaxID=70667 RepID=A0A183TP47_SCHSO|nr:unnamed protein product [Schistocephalus solidus]
MKKDIPLSDTHARAGQSTTSLLWCCLTTQVKLALFLSFTRVCGVLEAGERAYTIFLELGPLLRTQICDYTDAVRNNLDDCQKVVPDDFEALLNLPSTRSHHNYCLDMLFTTSCQSTTYCSPLTIVAGELRLGLQSDLGTTRSFLLTVTYRLQEMVGVR